MDKDLMSDDYVVNLLKQDAKVSAARYLKTGLGPLLPHKPNPNAPKPNTRFLRNIVQDADSHNAALLAKEKAESRTRLRKLREQEQRSHQHASDWSSRDNDRPRKRRRVEEEDERSRRVIDVRSRSPRRRRDHERSNSDSDTRTQPAKGSEPRRRFPGLERKRETEKIGGDGRQSERRSRDTKHDKTYRTTRRRDTSSPDEDRKIRQRSPRRARDTKSDEDGMRRRRSRDRQQDSRLRSISKSRSRSRSRERKHSRRKRTDSPSLHGQRQANRRDKPSLSGHTSRRHSSPPHRGKPTPPDPDSDSDPLESIIGPLPPTKPKVRGRGTTSSSTIDHHFSKDYDPCLEPPPCELQDLPTTTTNPDTDTWDDALKSFRDRQKWKQIGGERLKAAGFSESQVKTWQRGGRGSGERDERDVVWRKEGEGPREWDRGKVWGADGGVELRPEWGRLSP